MKRFFKFSKKLVKNFFSDKWNAALAVLVLLVVIIGIYVVGFIKTVFVGLLVIIIGLIIRYGRLFFMRRKGKNTQSKNNKMRRIIGRLIVVGLILGIICVIGGLLFMIYIVISAPKFDKNKLYYKDASVIYDIDGKEITRLGNEMRDKVTYDEIPQVFVDAIVATEDSRYFEHNGFDLPRFLKASAGQLMGKSSAGGASTISMQVIKNNFTSTNQSVVRKFTDIYLAIFKLEKNYTKEQILEFYVNDIHLGVNNTLGIAEASRGLFGKEIGDINLSEAALLAGMFQAPGAYNPYKYPEKAAARRSTVLYLMERHGYITSEERKIADSIPIEDLLVDQQNSGDPYQAYIDYACDEVKEKTGYDPMEVQMNIYTNLNPSKQNYINDILNGNAFTFENSAVQAGIAVTDVNTGAILALGAGRNRNAKKVFSFATDTKRQIGSTAKPIFDYGPGMEYNNWSTYTPFVDDVYTYSDGKPINDWDGKYNGMLTLRYALTESRNVPALKAFQQVDNKKIIEFAESLGITPEVENGKIHEAHAIGAFNGASPLQLAAAYAAFANGGYYIKPSAVNKVEIVATGETKVYKPEKVRVMSDSTAYMITNVLKYGVDNKIIGGGRITGIEVAAKSGTSNFDDATKEKYHLAASAVNDLWYAGYTPDYAIGMWYGYEKISSEHYSRSVITSGVRDKFFTAIAKGIFEKNGHTFTVPSSVVEISVELGTIPAMLPSANTPSNMITTEYFKKGTEPTEVSPRFNTLSNVTGLDASKSGSDVKLSWNAVSAPNMITDEYLKTIAAQTEKYTNIRKSEDASILGTLGYNVYIKNADGSLTLLGWTSNTTYTHKPTTSGSITYVVKTCYSIFKRSESTGAQFTLSNNTSVSSPPEVYFADDPNGTSTTQTKNITIGTSYSEPTTKNAITVRENGIVITEGFTITRTIKKNGETLSTSTDSVSLDTSTAATYIITYNITYNGDTQTLTRTINVA